MNRYDLTNLPEEVTDYAFDQLPDRLDQERILGQLRVVRGTDAIESDYDAQTVTFDHTILGGILHDALLEKIQDMGWEIRHGERMDYDMEDYERWMDVLNAVIEGDGPIETIEVPRDDLVTVMEFVAADPSLDHALYDSNPIIGAIERIERELPEEHHGRFA